MLKSTSGVLAHLLHQPFVSTIGVATLAHKMIRRIMLPLCQAWQGPGSIDINQDPQTGKAGGGMTWLRQVGVLRLAIATLVLASLPMSLLRSDSHEGLWIIPGQVMPGLVLLLLWSLPFDIIVSRVTILVGSVHPNPRKYRAVLFLDLAMIAALLLFWGPFFYRLLADR